jgi:hypothetical protein
LPRSFSLGGLLAVTLLAACGPRSRPAAVAEQVEAPPATAASAPLRRLTQEQYRNSVRDLLGIREVGVDLTIDEGVAGFHGNTIAPVSELHLEKYGRAAELVARQAVTRLPALLPCDPDRAGEVPCARAFITAFGRRAFRRPLTADELSTYQALFQAGRREGDFASGARLVLQAMLQSPHFLYLMEPRPAVGQAPVAPVPPFAMATRLAFFVWNSTPDDALLAAAEAGKLSTRAEVAAQVKRMLGDRRFGDTVSSFHLQWLDLTELGSVEKRNKIYPLFTHELRGQMREETVRFVDHVVREGDGSLDTLLGAPFSIVGGKLYELYGLGKREGADAGWQKVDLTAAHRAGLLTQAAVMTAHAHWDKSSLVLRGKLIREKLFCTVLPPPPPDVNNTLPQADPKVSTRERFEDHRLDFGCAKCHKLIDPLGIPFENYDGIGAWRTSDGPAPVDPSSEIDGTAASNGPVKDALELTRKLAGSNEVRDCLALQWFRYAIGRDEQTADDASLAQVRRAFRESGYKVPALVAAIALTDSFRYQRTQP